MNYEKLSLSGFVKEIKEVSNGPHPRKFCFVLGAGASKTSGIRSGQELVDIWEQELLERNKEGHEEWKKKLKITDENKYEHYSRYYERRFKLPMDGYNYLEKLMESAKPSIGYVMLSYILTHTNHNVVVTTNFDHLLEDAVNYYERTIPMVIGHESLAHYVTKQINRPMIIKIHRDLLLDPKNRASELDELHDSWKEALGILFSEYHPIFIGYAGNDRSLMDFLCHNHEKFLNKEWAVPYWMRYKTDTISGMVQSFLDGSEGYLIEHNGFDEALYLLGAALDYHMPTKEEFLNDAEKRFQRLSDSIDEFTQKTTAKKDMGQKEDGPAEHGVSGSEEVHQAIQKITSQTESQDLFREATLLFNEHRYEEAEPIFRELTDKNPENARYHSCLGTTLYMMKRYEEALKEEQRAAELDPADAFYHSSVGATLYAMGRYEEALEEKQKAVELEPTDAFYHSTLSTTLYAMRRYEEALKEIQIAVKLDPDNVRYSDLLKILLDEMNH